MARLSALLLILSCGLLPGVAHAAQRSAFVGSFERVRVQGPFEVAITTGRSPAASLAGDRDAIDAVDLRVDGATLVVQAKGGTRQETGPQRQESGQPVRVTLATPSLSFVSVIGAARVKVTRIKAERVDLSVAGSGSIAVDQVDAGQANVTTVGNAAVTAAGKATRMRLFSNGAGLVDVSALEAGDLLLRADGNGEVRARARYTADVGNSGLGQVSVVGTAKCRILSRTGGPITCGQNRQR